MQAAAYNAFVDAAVALRAHTWQKTGGSPIAAPAPGVVLIRNATGNDLAQYGIAQLGNQVAIAPIDDLAAYQAGPVFTAEAPEGSDRPVVIAQQPILADAIGPALIGGISPVRLLLTEPGLDHAAPIAEDSTRLQAAMDGPWRILHHEHGSDGDEVWAIVQGPVAQRRPIVTSLQVGRGNFLATYSQYDFRGVRRVPVATPITSVPSAMPNAVDSYPDGLTEATELASDTLVWLATLAEVDGALHSDLNYPIPEGVMALSRKQVRLPVDGQPDTFATVYLPWMA